MRKVKNCLSNNKINSSEIIRVQRKVKKNAVKEKSMRRGSVVLSQIWIRAACGVQVKSIASSIIFIKYYSII